MKRHLVVAGALLALAMPVVSVAQTTALPKASEGRAAYAPFAPLVGKTWRGKGVGPAGGTHVEDIQRWEWILGGQAIRITHSVNNGAYAGESVVFRAPDGDGPEGIAYVYTYVTTGGFYTTGVMRAKGAGAFVAEETVHGVPGLGKLKAVGTLGEDGVYRMRSSMDKDGQWVETGGFDYSEDASAVPVMPTLK